MCNKSVCFPAGAPTSCVPSGELFRPLRMSSTFLTLGFAHENSRLQEEILNQPPLAVTGTGVTLPFGRVTVVGLLAAVLLSLPPVRGSRPLPPAPAAGEFIYDAAHLLRPADREAIQRIQRDAFAFHDTPIVVVTIRSISDYSSGTSIEDLAAMWFNHWGIGKRLRNGQLANRGILLLVAVYDRQARIELGGDWGFGWDRHAQSIMNETIVAHFKEGDYSGGIRQGVAALAKMAERGPEADAPSYPSPRTNPAFLPTPYPWWMCGIILIAGIGVLAYGLADAKNRVRAIVLGVALIIGAFSLLVLMLTIAFMKTGGSSGSSSGGYSTGGFSGGGGATGSW